MGTRRPALLALVLLAVACSLLPVRGTLASECVWKGVKRIVAVGDVHGGHRQLVRVLIAARVIDRKLKWVGGPTHLVLLGDFVDRGPHSRRVIDLLMTLEEQAPGAGGRVHPLLGNHEALRLCGDYTYTHPGEFAEFRTEDAAKQRDELFMRHLEELRKAGDPAANDEKYRKRWYARRPVKKFQFIEGMSPEGRYGSWLKQLNVAIRLNDLVFVHGGISPKYSAMSLQQINTAVRHELRAGAESKPADAIVDDQLGPLWYRGLARGSSKMLRERLEVFLTHNEARRIVVAHTKSRGGIGVKLGGRVIMTDVESKNRGPAVCLVVEGDAFYEVSPVRRRRVKVGRPPPPRDIK